MPQKPPFDPNKPFEEVRDSKPAFDPNKAFEVVEDTPQQPVAPAVPGKPPAPSAPMVSPSTSVAGSSPAGSGAGPLDNIQPPIEPVQQAGSGAPIFTPGTESFATKSPLLPSQKPDAASTVTKRVVDTERLASDQFRQYAVPKMKTVQETDKAVIAETLSAQDEVNKEASYYLSNFADLDQKALDKRKAETEKAASATEFMVREFNSSQQRLQQQQDQLMQRRSMLESMAGKDQPILDSQGRVMDVVSYKQLEDQYNADARAFSREYTAMGIEADLLKGLAKNAEMDEKAIIRREFDIKAGIGNRPAGVAYSILNQVGSGLAGSLELIGKVVPTDREILEYVGVAKPGSGAASRKSWNNYLEDVESAPVRLTGVDQVVTPEYIQNLKNNSVFDEGLFTLAEMTPAIAASIVGGTPAMAATYFSSSYRDTGKEMQGELWDQVPEAEKEAIRIGVATVSAGLSTMGFQALAGRIPIVNDIFFKAAKKMLPGMTPGAIRRIIDAETKSYVANLASKGVQGFVLEGLEESADFTSEEIVKTLYENYKSTEFGEESNKLFNNSNSFKEYAMGLWDSFRVGGIAGSMLGGSMAALSNIGVRKRFSDKEFEMFKNIVDDGSLKQDFESVLAADLESGKINRSDYDKMLEDLKTAKGIVDQIPEDLSLKATREAYDLLEQKAKLKKKDKALVGDKIAAIDAKLMKLAGVEPTAKEGDVKTEAPTPPQAPVPVSPEVRDEILRARQELGVDFDPLEDLPESVVITFGRVEDNIPVSAVDIEAASSWMYKKYKEVMSMRNDPNRLLTLDQIDSYAAQLGADIELLENHKQKLRDESEGVGAAQAANTKGATAPVSGTQATETKPQGRVAPTATQVAPQAISPEGQVVPPLMTLSEGPSIGIGGGQGFVPRLRELGYTDAEISKMNFEQQQDIVEKGTEPARAESTARVTPTAKGPVSPVDGEMTVKSFAESIASGNRLDTPEAVQFYENNKKEIEAELRRMAGPQKQAPQQAPVDPNDDAEVTLDEEVADDPDALLEEAMGTPLTDEEIDAEMANIAKSVGGTDTDVIDLDQDGYAKAVKDASGDTSNSMSEGFFIGNDRDGKRRIYINRDMFRRGLMAHEGTHAIIFAALSKDPKAKKIISNSAKQALGASPGAKKVLLKFLENYGGAKTKADGSVDVDATVADPELGEEVISEFVAALYNGTIKLDNATRQFIRDLYNRIMAALGVSTKVEFKEDGDFIAAAKQIASAMKAGRKIKTGGRGADVTGTGSKFSRLAARTPGTKARPYDHNLAAVDPAAVDMDAMSDKALNKAADMLAKYPGMRLGGGSAKTRIAKAIDRMVGNILYLHDSFPEDVRKLAKEWYVGANKVSLEWAERYGVTPAQTAGVIAALSPQKDWFTNMSLAERVLEFVANHKDHKWDGVMADRAQKIRADYMDKIGRAKKSLANNPNNEKKRKEIRSYESAVEKLDIAVPKISGKVYSDLTTGNDKAWFLRIWDEANNDPSFNQYLPTGEKTVIQRNKAPKPTKKNPSPLGIPSKIAWQNAKSIAAAIDIAENGTSIDVVSRGIGEAHKVRSFYNNIFDPSSPDFTTIDTHAMAAAMFLPLSGSHPITSAGFGGLADSASGHSGLYPIYQRAYEIAAKQRGLLPREMQSITWEAVRGLFEKGQKAGAGSSASDVWKAMPNDPDGARAAVSDLFGGISTPGWMGSELQEADKPKFSKRQPDGSLNGLPRKFKVGGKEMEASHWQPAEDVAISYMEKAGLPYNPPSDYVKVDPARAKRIADAYEAMKHDPENPEVKEAYEALAKETIAQYEEVLGSGLKVEFIPPGSPDPYAASPRLATEDIRNNNHMWVFGTRDGFGSSDFDPSSNPLLEESGFEISGQPALVNDLFRVVHDYFGHVKEGVGFRADGEENAWRMHSSMFSPKAQRALTTETRGQNSWVNFGPQGEKNRTASGSDTVYADQKTGLLPMWVSEDGRNDSIEEADKPKFSKATPGKNVVPTKHRQNLTDDGKGNYVFFHKGPKNLKGGKIDPSYFGSGKTKDNRSNPVMNYYTKPDHGERMISGDVTYAVPVPKWKVYPLMSDPLDLYDKAEANFRKKFGKDQAFDAVRQADFIGPLAEKAGFDMMIAGWSVHPLRAESGKALKPDAKLTKKYEDEGVVDLTAPGAYERMMAKARGDVKFSKKTDQAFDGKKVPKTPIGDTKTVMVDGKERTVFNSNGKPIHPTVEGVENFWKWFGESKVVDKQGRPRVMYHGGTATTEFSREKIQIGGGFFFAPKKSYAALYAKRLGGAGVVTEAYLKADKLSESIENTREILKRAKDAGRTWIEQAKLDGFNGSVFLGGAEISVYEPNQIKSATGNYGSFDPSDPNIRFSSASPENIAKALIAKGYNTKAKAREYMVSKGADRMVDQVMAEFDKLRDAANARKASAQVTPTPPATPTPPSTTRQDGGGRPMRGSAKRMKEQYPELYAALGEDTIYYDRMPMTVTRDAASELVGWLGLERAKDEVLNRSSDIPDAVRAMMGRVVMKQLADEHRLAELDTFAENFFKLGTSAGQFINALRDVYEEFSKDMIFYRIQRIVEKEVEKKKGKDKNYKKLRDGLTKVNKEVAEEVIRTRKVRDKATDASFPKPDPSNKPKTTPAYGTKNKVVKKSQYDQAWRELSSMLPSGVAIPQLVTIATYHIEAGSRSFADVAERVIAKGGRKLLPYLKGSYKQAAKDMGIEPSSDAEIDEYINKANTEKIVDKLRKAIKAKDKKSEAAAIAALQQVAKDDGLWGKYRKEAVSRLTRLADQDIKDDIQKDTIIAEFTAGLVRNITDQMKKEAEAKGLESKEPKTPKSAIEIIGDAYRNFDKYEQVWKDTQSEWKRRLNAAEARLAKATTPEAKQKAQADIVNEQSRLDRLDAYYGELMIKPFSEAAIGRAVKDGMKELDQKIDNIIRQHYTVYEAAKQTLADKLVQGAGLTEVEAAKLADAVKAEFERLATERKKALVEQYAKRKFGDKKPARPKAGIQEELILLSNTGAFSDKEFAEKYGEMRGWPRLTEADIAELNRLSDRIQTAKEGRPKLEATEDLLSFQENLSGVSKWEVAQSVWFANMLSGFETQEVNFLSNQINLAMEVGVAVSKSTVKGKPMDAVNIVRALGYGFARGWYEAGAVMSTGYSPIRGRVDIPPALERYKFPKYLGMYNGLKMVRRVMVAADVLGFEPLKELRAYQYAAMKARSVDPSPIDRQRALDILNRDDDTIAGAKQQAEDEYQADLKAIEERNLTAAEKRKAIAKAERDKKRRSFELVELARDPEVLQESARFAARATYNYTPEGVLGAVAKGVNMILRELPALRYVVPFVNIIANVTNEALNYYAPVGIARAIAGGSVADTIMGRANKGMTEDQKKMQREDLVSKAVIGLVLQAAVLVLSDPGDDDDPLIEITANGYNNYKQNSEMESKGLWKPYSFRFRGTDTWISYQYTPLLFAFGLVGHLRDATKYRKEKMDDSTMTKYAVAMQRNIGTITDASFLATTADALGWLNDTKEGGLDGLARSTAKTVKAMVVPYSALLNQIQQNMDSAFGVPKMDARGSLTAELIKNTPVAYFVRDKFPIMVDALGDPIIPSSGALRRFATTSDPDPSLLQKLFISAPAPDRFWRLMVDKKYPLSAPNPKTVTVYDDEAEKERILTEDELFKFYQLRGSMIKMELNDRFDELSTLDNKEFAEEMMAIQSYATTEAKWEATEME